MNNKANKPKGQHILSKVYLKNFINSEGWLHCTRSLESQIFLSKPENTFIETHAYTKKIGGIDDYTLERYFSSIESELGKVFNQVIVPVSLGIVPNLGAIDKELLDLFFYFSFKRAPEKLDFYFNKENFSYVKEMVSGDLLRLGLKKNEIDSIFTHEWLIKSRHVSIQADIIGSLSPRIKRRFKDFTYSYGIIDKTCCSSFITGTQPIIRVQGVNAQYHKEMHNQLWLPVSSKIAIRLVPKEWGSGLTIFNDLEQIKMMNSIIASNSSQIAGKSRKVILESSSHMAKSFA